VAKAASKPDSKTVFIIGVSLFIIFVIILTLFLLRRRQKDKSLKIINNLPK
jgi:predicted small secreted protein